MWMFYWIFWVMNIPINLLYLDRGLVRNPSLCYRKDWQSKIWMVFRWRVYQWQYWKHQVNDSGRTDEYWIVYLIMVAGRIQEGLVFMGLKQFLVRVVNAGMKIFESCFFKISRNQRLKSWWVGTSKYVKIQRDFAIQILSEWLFLLLVNGYLSPNIRLRLFSRGIMKKWDNWSWLCVGCWLCVRGSRN